MKSICTSIVRAHSWPPAHTIGHDKYLPCTLSGCDTYRFLLLTTTISLSSFSHGIVDTRLAVLRRGDNWIVLTTVWQRARYTVDEAWLRDPRAAVPEDEEFFSIAPVVVAAVVVVVLQGSPTVSGHNSVGAQHGLGSWVLCGHRPEYTGGASIKPVSSTLPTLKPPKRF